MKALVKMASGPGNLELRDLPDPLPGPGEVVIQVAATGICGTDLHIQDDEYKVVPPVAIGHETAGTVVAAGEGVTTLAPGARVTALTTISTCGMCALCRSGRTNLCPERRWLGGHVDGGFATYLRVPAANALALPESVSLEAGALTEPLACCVHGVLEVALPEVQGGERTEDEVPALAPSVTRGRRTKDEGGKTKEHSAFLPSLRSEHAFPPSSFVVVSGPGPIGLLCAQVARAAGASVTILGTGSDQARFALARRLGFAALVDVESEDPVAAVNRLTGGRGPTLVIEAAGAAASLDQCLRLAPRGGLVLQIGLYGRPVPVPVDTLVLKEIRLLGSFSSTPTAWPLALELMGSGRVQMEPLVTSKRPLAEWETAFRAARQKSEGKILLVP